MAPSLHYSRCRRRGAATEAKMADKREALRALGNAVDEASNELCRYLEGKHWTEPAPTEYTDRLIQLYEALNELRYDVRVAQFRAE